MTEDLSSKTPPKPRVSNRTCPGYNGVDGPVRCGRSMHGAAIDRHSFCRLCAGVSCSNTNRCLECNDWSDGEMEVFEARDNYKLSRKLLKKRNDRLGNSDFVDPTNHGEVSVETQSTGDPPDSEVTETSELRRDVEQLRASMQTLIKVVTDGYVAPTPAPTTTEEQQVVYVVQDSMLPTGNLPAVPKFQYSGGIVDPADNFQQQQVGIDITSQGVDKVKTSLDRPLNDLGQSHDSLSQGHQGGKVTDFAKQGQVFVPPPDPSRLLTQGGTAKALDLVTGELRMGVKSQPPLRVDLRSTSSGRSTGQAQTPNPGQSANPSRQTPTQRGGTPATSQTPNQLGGMSAIDLLRSLLGSNRSASNVDAQGSTAASPANTNTNSRSSCQDDDNMSVIEAPPTSSEAKREELDQISFSEIRGWLWEKFPDLCPKPDEREDASQLRSLSQSMAKTQTEEPTPSLPWSPFHQAIDQHLINQVAGHRDGKRDRPLAKGGLLSLRRISKVYRVAGDNVALEPSVTPSDWFQLSGELPSTARSVTLSNSDADSLESSFRRSRAISNFMDWQIALLTSMLDDSTDDQVDLDRVRQVVQSLDRGSAQLAWETSTGMANVQLKRRDLMISKLSSTVPEDNKQALRASTFGRADLFEKSLIKRADASFREATQRKATLTLLGSRPPPVQSSSFKKNDTGTKRAASPKPQPKRKRSRGQGGSKRGGKTTPHSSAPAKRGGGRGQSK